MEFFCVLSVGGSLAYYEVFRENENAYKAILRNNNGQRDDIPSEISLTKQGDDWQANPPHGEIVPGLVQAIKGAGAQP